MYERGAEPLEAGRGGRGRGLVRRDARRLDDRHRALVPEPQSTAVETARLGLRPGVDDDLRAGRGGRRDGLAARGLEGRTRVAARAVRAQRFPERVLEPAVLSSAPARLGAVRSAVPVAVGAGADLRAAALFGDGGLVARALPRLGRDRGAAELADRAAQRPVLMRHGGMTMIENFGIAQIIDAVIVFTLIECVALVIYHRRTGRGVAVRDFFANMVSGLCLMFALRCLATDAGAACGRAVPAGRGPGARCRRPDALETYGSEYTRDTERQRMSPHGRPKGSYTAVRSTEVA